MSLSWVRSYRRLAGAVAFVAISLMAAACSVADTPGEIVQPLPDPTATSEPAAAMPTSTPVPVPTAQQSLTSGNTQVLPAPLGTYVVARPGAGMRWQRDDDFPSLEIPVYDEPGGEKRTLLDVNHFDRVTSSAPLLNWSELGSPLVLRVLAGGPADEWIQVQSPVRPNRRSVWVRSEHFDFGFTTKRIEVDLAGQGRLRVLDGDNELLRSPIVQGRAERPSPTLVTYLEWGTPGSNLGPAYGHAVLGTASYSESLGSFGENGRPPYAFFHGTNQPELMGQRVSSHKIRLPDEKLIELIDLVVPGTPILVYDGAADRDAILAMPPRPAETKILNHRTLAIDADPVRIRPQLWVPCSSAALVCRNPALPSPTLNNSPQYLFAVAPPFQGDEQIPVYDSIDGPPRTLVDVNAIDQQRRPYPLFPQTVFGGQLVLRVVNKSVDNEWLKVQVPVRPNHSTVWVRADDFDLKSTDVRLEATTTSMPGAQAGLLRAFRGDNMIFEAPVASGRAGRATPAMTGWVSEVVGGAQLGPAYGTWFIDVGGHSEALGSFGVDSSMPRMGLHGTRQPELIGQRISSGALRLTNDKLDQLRAIEGLLGAPITISEQRFAPANTTAFFTTQPATTTNFLPDAEPVPVSAL